MKKNDFLMGILSVVLIFGMALLVGCKTEDDDGDGTTNTPTTLTAGQPVTVAATDTTANVTFTGATGLTLRTADFRVTSGGSITNVSVTSDTATVTVTFLPNTSTTESKTYTVSIVSSSAVIKGTATVAITQEAGSGGGSLSWTAVTSTFSPSSIYGVTYGGGKFVAVGDDSQMAYSNPQE
jgi:hypothetical protein